MQVVLRQSQVTAGNNHAFYSQGRNELEHRTQLALSKALAQATPTPPLSRTPGSSQVGRTVRRNEYSQLNDDQVWTCHSSLTIMIQSVFVWPMCTLHVSNEILDSRHNTILQAVWGYCTQFLAPCRLAWI